MVNAMRMRKKKNLGGRMERVSDLMIRTPDQMRGNWHTLSGEHEIRLEIGCGKGKFICDTAAAHPELFFVAIEKIPDVLVMAMEKADRAEVKNVAFMCGDASLLANYFAPGEISLIYLNFSDPWPSNRHRSRRLTSEGFLRIYSGLLAGKGAVHFKTDNRDLFEFSVKEFTRCGWPLKNVTRDLHGILNHGGISDIESIRLEITEGEGGAVTEYEQRFTAMGVPINRLEALTPPHSEPERPSVTG